MNTSNNQSGKILSIVMSIVAIIVIVLVVLLLLNKPKTAQAPTTTDNATNAGAQQKVSNNPADQTVNSLDAALNTVNEDDLAADKLNNSSVGVQ